MTLNSIFYPGFVLLGEYIREHTLFCLIPAFFIAGAISVFVKKNIILKYLGKKTKKIISYTIASVSGSVLAVCSCTVLPMFAGIRKRGAGLGPAVTFLFSGPAINVAAMFLTISVLGIKIGLARIVASILIAILVGISMEKIFKEKTDDGELLIEKDTEIVNKKTTIAFFTSMVSVLVINGLQINQTVKYWLIFLMLILVIVIAVTKLEKEKRKQWLSETWIFFKTLAPYLLVGVFVIGVITPFIPQEMVQKWVGSNSITSNLLSSVFGAIMYFSTLTEILIIQALRVNGMHHGPALTLLLTGPSLSLPNMLVIRKIMGNFKTFVYISLVILYSTIAGLLFGYLF